MSITAPDLLRKSSDELDDLFRAGSIGPIPNGAGEGEVIFDPDSELAETAAKLAHLIAWKGKVFDAAAGELRNEIGPTGHLAIRAKVYQSKSWFDGEEAIILDYSKTSLIAHWIRDEIRQICPGLYLGIVYWERKKILNFSLQFDVPAA